MVAHYLGVVGVARSNRVRPTIFFCEKSRYLKSRCLKSRGAEALYFFTSAPVIDGAVIRMPLDIPFLEKASCIAAPIALF